MPKDFNAPTLPDVGPSLFLLSLPLSGQSVGLRAGTGLRTPFSEIRGSTAFYVHPESAILLSYARLSEDSKEENSGSTFFDAGRTAHVEGTAYSVSYQQFFSDSFYHAFRA